MDIDTKKDYSYFQATWEDFYSGVLCSIESHLTGIFHGSATGKLRNMFRVSSKGRMLRHLLCVLRVNNKLLLVFWFLLVRYSTDCSLSEQLLLKGYPKG